MSNFRAQAEAVQEECPIMQFVSLGMLIIGKLDNERCYLLGLPPRLIPQMTSITKNPSHPSWTCWEVLERLRLWERDFSVYQSKALFAVFLRISCIL